MTATTKSRPPAYLLRRCVRRLKEHPQHAARPMTRRRSAAAKPHKCVCGGSRATSMLCCRPCWKLIPQTLRHRFRAATHDWKARQGVAREIIEYLREKHGPRDKRVGDIAFGAAALEHPPELSTNPPPFSDDSTEWPPAP